MYRQTLNSLNGLFAVENIQGQLFDEKILQFYLEIKMTTTPLVKVNRKCWKETEIEILMIWNKTNLF